jgi:phosphopantothenoylcysteine decarboxylase/phosphopantothenate--cysteine ligase
MDLDMYAHPTTSENLKMLESHGVHVIPAAHGELASGLTGQGRMAEPQDIARVVADFFQVNNGLPLSGQKILITAGPTYEAMDPVRFIGNHSTGKMGIALADEAAALGAEVKLVLGPSALRPINSSVEVISVQSANEMWEAVKQQWEQCTAGIFAAAVADYRPEHTQLEKIKKTGETLQLNLVKNPDILQWAGAHKNQGQVLTGFALETTNEEVHAREKLEKKNLDFIVLNSLNDQGAGFGHDTNRVSLIDKHNNIRKFELLSKTETAREIIKHIFAIA